MSDHPRRPDLRAVVPTLEPGEAFLAELSGRAAAASARPGGGWRVALVPVAVAALLIGVAWLTGIRTGLPDPSPAPAPMGPTRTSPSAPSSSAPSSATALRGPQRQAPAGTAPSATAAPGSSSTGTAPADQSQDQDADPASPTGPAQPAGAAHSGSPGRGHAYGHTRRPHPRPSHRPGPDAHAGDHPAARARGSHGRR